MSDEQVWLEVIEARDAAGLRVRLRGELDLASAPRLTECLETLRDRREDVVLDLDELTFIDMSGLRVVLWAAEESSRDGWDFATTPGSAPVRRLLELVELDGHLPLDGRTP